MAIIAPWTEAPNFQGAIEAGSRLGLEEQQMHDAAEQHAAELSLRRDELSAQMAQAAAARGQQQQQEAAANALRAAALKQQGLLGGERVAAEDTRNDNTATQASAADALRQSALKQQQGQFDQRQGDQSAIQKDTQGAAEMISKIQPGQPKPTAADVLLYFPKANLSALAQMDKTASTKTAIADPNQNRLAADYLLAQNKTNPTNSVANVLSQYRTATTPPPASDAIAAPTAESVDGLSSQGDDSLVPIINPQGKRVRIKSSDVDDALQQGYSQP